MKINIITFFWSNNLGALIQANSLKDFIQKKAIKQLVLTVIHQKI